MHLYEYQWSRNPRGLHNKQAPIKMNIGELVAMKLGWAKYVAIDGEYVNDTAECLSYNITPIIRIWRPRFGAGVPDGEMLRDWRNYVAAGAKWFEYYNEPNLDTEWAMDTPNFHYTNIAGMIAPLLQNWMDWAELIISMGAYPAFPALSETVGNKEDVTSWLDVMMNYLADNFYDRFRNIAENGMWVATHPYIYNHYYQERSGPFDARPPEQQRANEGGWHFEYPYDPITQASQPGLTTVSGGADFPRGDPIGLTGMGDAFMIKFQEIFGGGAVPVVGTEGGITPVPTTQGEYRQLDARFPGYTWDSHGEATVALFDWISRSAPPWFFGLTLWKEDDYFELPAGKLRAVYRLRETNPIPKSVPDIAPLDGPGPRALYGGRGPGPIHGAPNYHFLMLSPDFDENWFFTYAREYWNTFRPTILTSPDFFKFIPYRKSAGIVVLSTPENADAMREAIAAKWSTIWFDMLVTSDPTELARILLDRAVRGLRYGDTPPPGSATPEMPPTTPSTPTPEPSGD
jgi:hypothetical protein